MNEIFLGKQDFYTVSQGLYVAIHNRTRRPSVKYEGITVQTGTASNIEVTKTVYSKLDAPFSSCRKDVKTILPTDSEIFIKSLQITEYSQKICYEVCLQYVRIIDQCGCADPSVPIIDKSYPLCMNETTLACVKSVRDEFDSNSIQETCDSYCPLECDSMEFSTSVSSSNYPSDYYLTILRQQANFTNKYNPTNTFSPSIHFSYE